MLAAAMVKLAQALTRALAVLTSREVPGLNRWSSYHGLPNCSRLTRSNRGDKK